uniref:RNase H type-1 domain-containing protein n=2 Tax=Phytophthora fragariae TaxID=53985 RepID=A0A6A3EGG7_9STRA|nr:hypothetical protein PF009_g18339 [Phytophthora fragariae]
MDASYSGLCALHPASQAFLRVQFDEEERALIARNASSINVREQLTALLAVVCWGHAWVAMEPHTLTHIRFWIDNTSAVSWCNALQSRDAQAQELNRVLGAVEARW